MMSTDLLDRSGQLGTSGYGVFAGEDDEDTELQPSTGGGQQRSGTTLGGQKGALKKRGSQRSSFYGRLGTKHMEAEPEAALSKMETGKAPLFLKQLRVQLSYEEEAFPAGLELEDAAGAFSLNVSTHSMAIDLSRVPEECGVIVLAVAVYTHGISLTEIEMGRITISGGFMGPTLKQIALGSLQAPSNGYDSSGLIYFVVGEADGEWFYKNSVVFSRASLDALMVPSKGLAQEMATEMQHPEAFGLSTLDSLIKDAARNKVRRLSQSSDDTKTEGLSTNSLLRQSLDRANSLRQRIADIKSSLRSREDLENGAEGKNSGFSLLSKRLNDCERRQTELEVSLHQLQSKIDYLYAYVGVEELHSPRSRGR